MRTILCRSGRGRSGFSLIELVLVTGIVATLAAIAIPRYGQALNRYRADVAARRIAADLALAQARARSASGRRSISFDVAGNRYRLLGERDLATAAADWTVDLGASPYFAALGTASFGVAGVASLSFDGYGAPDNGGFVRITSGGITRTIAVDASSGVASIQ